MFMIRRQENLKNGHPAYVNRTGSKNAYTSSKLRCRKFDTMEEALSECCGNEFPVST